jgi:hypothetical protein
VRRAIVRAQAQDRGGCALSQLDAALLGPPVLDGVEILRSSSSKAAFCDGNKALKLSCACAIAACIDVLLTAAGSPV